MLLMHGANVKMEVVCSYKTMVPTHQPISCNNPENNSLILHCCDNFMSFLKHVLRCLLYCYTNLWSVTVFFVLCQWFDIVKI